MPGFVRLRPRVNLKQPSIGPVNARSHCVLSTKAKESQGVNSYEASERKDEWLVDGGWFIQ